MNKVFRWRSFLLAGALTASFAACRDKPAQANEQTSPATTSGVVVRHAPATGFLVKGAEQKYLGHSFNALWVEEQEIWLENPENKKNYNAWLAALAPLKKQPLLAKLEKINTGINARVTYITDSAGHGRREYWKPPVLTVLSGKGDCEDYALAKYTALEYLAVPENRRLLLAVSIGGTGDADHTVVAVDTSAANNWHNCLLLDNRHDRPLTLGESGYGVDYMVDKKRKWAASFKPE